MILRTHLGWYHVARTCKWIQNLHSFLTSHRPCGLCTNKRSNGQHLQQSDKVTILTLQNSCLEFWWSWIVLKQCLPIILTRSPNWNGQSSWAPLTTDLMVLLLVHSASNSPFYKCSQRKAPTQVRPRHSSCTVLTVSHLTESIGLPQETITPGDHTPGRNRK